MSNNKGRRRRWGYRNSLCCRIRRLPNSWWHMLRTYILGVEWMAHRWSLKYN